MAKKNIIEEALIEAKELERASIDNAREIVLESFTPDFKSFFKDILTENEDNDEDDEDGDSDPNEDELDETDHDIGKYNYRHDGGKGFVQESDDEDEDDEDDDTIDESDDEDEDDESDDEMDLEEVAYVNRLRREGEYDDVDGDKDPEKGGYNGLDNVPKVKQVGDSGWEDEGESGFGDPGPEKGQGPLPAGSKPKVKQTSDGWEDEGTAGFAGDDPEKGGKNGLDGVPSVKQTGDGGWEAIHEDDEVDLDDIEDDDEEDDDDKDLEEIAYINRLYEEDEEDDEDDEDEELEVPEELFDDDDEEDNTKGTDGDDDVDIEDDFDGDDDEEADDDNEKDTVKEDDDVNIDVEDDEESDEDDDENEKVNENLYVRYNGGFKKITPGEYLKTRIDTLQEENSRLKRLARTQQSQLKETHLFNAKLAHMNKLFMTGAFTNAEKTQIAGKLDECASVTSVKALYKTIISEVQNVNPLDDFSKLIKEQRTARGTTKTENIYESADVARMRQLVDFNNGNR